MIIVLILAILFWLGGYFMTARKMSDAGVLSDELEKIIVPPKWLYYLCGAPHSRDYPRGTMRVAAFRAQILGIVWMIYLIYSRIWKMSQMENLMGLALGLVIALLIVSYISIKYDVKDKGNNRRKKKGV